MSETPRLPRESVEELLALGREAFGMDVALFSEFTGGSEADIGSYIGVEVKTSDGRSYGTLCLLSHEPATWLEDYDVTLLERFTRDVTRLLERKGLM
jgi:hypothetical protein